MLKVNQFDPYLTGDEIALVVETIKKNWITEGEKTAQFQNMLQEYCRVKHAILLPNGTLALFVALMIMDIGPGDEVIVPAFTFVGSATSVCLTGAKPVFCDVSLTDFNIDISSARKCISRRTKAIMPVHIYGQSADMGAVKALAKEFNLRIIEDAAQGLAVWYGKKHVGTIGDVGCMSFYADKTLTTGEGGAVFTNSDKLAESCMYFKNQGRLHRGSFIHPCLGYNFRVTDLQAAIGVAQMRKLDFIIQRKHENESLYQRLLKDVGEVRFAVDNNLGKRVPFRVNVMVDDPQAVGDWLTKKGIGVRRWFYPLYRQPCFNPKNSRQLKAYPNADEVFSRGLSLPSGVGLSGKQIKYVCDTIKDYYRG